MRIDDYSDDLRKVVDSEGYVFSSYGGYGYSYGQPKTEHGAQVSVRCSMCGPELIPQAIAAGAIVVDTSHLSFSDNAEVICGAPMAVCKYERTLTDPDSGIFGKAGRSTDPDWTGLLSVSYCDIRTYACIAYVKGATLHNTPTPTAEELSKANAYWAASKACSAQYAAEREAKRAAEIAALELDSVG